MTSHRCPVANLPSWAVSQHATVDLCSTARSGCTASLPPPRQHRSPAHEDEDGGAHDSELPEHSVLALYHHGNAELSASLHTPARL